MRARIRRLPYAILKRYPQGRFALIGIQSLVGLPGRWIVAERLENGNELVRAEHRSKKAALKSLERLLRFVK